MEELVAPLLSSGGLQGGLSTPDLHFLLESMQLKTEEIKDRVYTTVRSHYKEFVDLVSRASEAAFDTEALFHEFREVLEDAAPWRQTGEFSFDSKICNIASEVQMLQKDLRIKQSALDVVNSAVSLRNGILYAKELFDKGHIVQGATELIRWQKELVRGAESRGHLVLYSLLEDLWRRVHSEMKSALENMFFGAVSLNTRDGSLEVISVALFGDRDIELEVVLEAMDVANVLDDCFSHVVDSLQKSLVAFVNDPSRKVAVLRDREKATLTWPTNSSSEGPLTPEDVYDRLLRFVKFIHAHLVYHHKEWTTRFGKLIWPKLADLIIDGCLRKAVPVDPNHFSDLQRVQALTSDFEKALEVEGFILLKGKPGKLGHFASEMEGHFAANKRNRVLAKARHLIVQFDYVFFLQVLERTEEKSELLFRREEYAVSYLPKQLLSIVHEVLKDACSCTPRVASELYRAARDVILLFRAVVSVRFGDSMPQAAAVCYNDCLYIADELLALGYQYKSTMESTSTFVDLVSLFHRMADDILAQQLQTQTNSLMEVLDTARGFKSTDERRNREAARASIERVVRAIKSIQRAWCEVLPTPVGERLVQSLIEDVMQRIVCDVVFLDDIGAEETVELHNLLEDLTAKLLSVLEDSSGKLSPDTVPSWKKLKWLSAILDMSMLPITKAWECGELRSAGFSYAEVRKLIRAIFTDTSLRSECLERIAD